MSEDLHPKNEVPCNNPCHTENILVSHVFEVLQKRKAPNTAKGIEWVLDLTGMGALYVRLVPRPGAFRRVADSFFFPFDFLEALR
jgi:hypothetical protein